MRRVEKENKSACTADARDVRALPGGAGGSGGGGSSSGFTPPSNPFSAPSDAQGVAGGGDSNPFKVRGILSRLVHLDFTFVAAWAIL